MLELVTKYVIPKWQKYLHFKALRLASENAANPRTDTIWKKILRDVREFYRILFRARFHYLDFKDRKGALKCVEILFEELGILLPDEYKKDIKLFAFIHQSHKLTNQRIFDIESAMEVSPFEVIEKFNEGSRKSFMSDKVGSQMFYFVFTNFLPEYCKFINFRYQLKAMTMIGLLLRCYSKMSEEAHLQRTHFLLS